MPRVTLADIAAETGYAVSTISNVLNNNKTYFASAATRRKISETAARMGYVPDHFARGLRARKSWVIGVAARLASGPTQASQLAAIKNECRNAGYFASFGDIEAGLVETLEAMVRTRPDGIIIWNDRDDAKPLEVPSDLPVPIVAMTSMRVPTCPCVLIDRVEGSFRATNYLIKLGHRRIIFLSRKAEYNRGKIEGYRRAMVKAGLAGEGTLLNLPETWWLDPNFISDNLATFRSATAVFAQGELVAAEFLADLSRTDIKVPRDLSLIGYGDSLAMKTTPHLTTVVQPREEMAQTAVDMIVKMIAGQPVRSKRIIPHLLIRDSVAPPRSKSRK